MSWFLKDLKNLENLLTVVEVASGQKVIAGAIATRDAEAMASLFKTAGYCE